MAAVAIEPLGFGCRRDPLTIKKGAEATACQPSAGAALLFVQTMLGWRVYDVMRANRLDRNPQGTGRPPRGMHGHLRRRSYLDDSKH